VRLQHTFIALWALNGGEAKIVAAKRHKEVRVVVARHEGGRRKWVLPSIFQLLSLLTFYAIFDCLSYSKY
jgi:hypothetical protein